MTTTPMFGTHRIRRKPPCAARPATKAVRHEVPRVPPPRLVGDNPLGPPLASGLRGDGRSRPRHTEPMGPQPHCRPPSRGTPAQGAPRMPVVRNRSGCEMTPSVHGTKEGMVNLRIGSRHGVDLQPRDALAFADQVRFKANEMMLIWESRQGLYCPHGTDPTNCIACTTAANQVDEDACCAGCKTGNYCLAAEWLQPCPPCEKHGTLGNSLPSCLVCQRGDCCDMCPYRTEHKGNCCCGALLQ